MDFFFLTGVDSIRAESHVSPLNLEVGEEIVKFRYHNFWVTSARTNTEKGCDTNSSLHLPLAVS